MSAPINIPCEQCNGIGAILRKNRTEIVVCLSCRSARQQAYAEALLKTKLAVCHLLELARASLHGAEAILQRDVVRYEPVPDLREAIAVIEDALTRLPEAPKPREGWDRYGRAGATVKT